MKKRTLKELNLLDDFLFGSMLTHPEYGQKFCCLLLGIIFNREFQNLTIIPQKVYYGADTTLHGTRLDVYIEENSTDNNAMGYSTVYDVEPDEKDNKELVSALPKRVRFYHAKIDTKSLESGADYSALKNVIVIMITPYDPFGRNHMIYTVENHVRELPDIPYNDGSCTIFFYTKGELGNPSESIRQLLHYMEDTRPGNAVNETLKEIQDMVNEVKEDKELNTNYMKILEREQMLIRKGVSQGILQEKENTERERKRADEEAKRADEEAKRADTAESELAELKSRFAKYL